MAKKLKLRLWLRKLTIRAFRCYNVRMSPPRTSPSPSPFPSYNPVACSAAIASNYSSSSSSTPSSSASSPSSSATTTYPPPRPSSAIASHIHDLSFLDLRLSQVLSLPRPPSIDYASLAGPNRRESLDSSAGNLSPLSLHLHSHDTETDKSFRSSDEPMVFCGCVSGPFRRASAYFRRKLRKLVGGGSSSSMHEPAAAKTKESRSTLRRNDVVKSNSSHGGAGDRGILVVDAARSKTQQNKRRIVGRNSYRGATKKTSIAGIVVSVSPISGNARGDDKKSIRKKAGADQKSIRKKSVASSSSNGGSRQRKKNKREEDPEEKATENRVPNFDSAAGKQTTAVNPSPRQLQLNMKTDEIGRSTDFAEVDGRMSPYTGADRRLHHSNYPASFTSEESAFFSSLSRSSRRSFSSSNFSTATNDGTFNPFILSAGGDSNYGANQKYSIDRDLDDNDDRLIIAPIRDALTRNRRPHGAGEGGGLIDMKMMAHADLKANRAWVRRSAAEQNMDDGRRQATGAVQLSGRIGVGRSVVLRRRRQRRRRRRRQEVQFRQRNTAEELGYERHGEDEEVKERGEAEEGGGGMWGGGGRQKRERKAEDAAGGRGGGGGGGERYGGKLQEIGGGEAAAAAAAAEVKRSREPMLDFQISMAEMILEKRMRTPSELAELLRCYLRLNREEHHSTIVAAFTELVGDSLLPRHSLNHHRHLLHHNHP